MRITVMLALLALTGRAEGQAEPTDLLRRAQQAMGGERLSALSSLRLTGIGYRNALEQSERPEGPWLKIFEQFVELRDLRTTRVRRTIQTRSAVWGPDWSPPLAMVADTGAAAWERGGRVVRARAADREEAVEALRLGPERVIATAASAADLRALPDTIIAGVRNHRVTFRFGDRRAELLFDANTLLPSGYLLRGKSARGFDWVWGDVTRAVWFSLWSFDPPGIRYPRIIVEELNGQPLREVALTAVEFDAAAPPDSFALSDSLRAGFRTAAGRAPTPETAILGRSFQGESVPAIDVADGLTIVPGPWYVALIRQADGVLVLEAPISTGYSAQVLTEAARRYPGAPIKGVITTSDAWPHVAGVPEYVNRGIPVHFLDLNGPLLERLVAARRERAPRGDRWRAVAGRTQLGDGADRLDVIPMRGEGGERMMLLWWPRHRLLYASDLIQRQPGGGFFWPEYLLEVVEVVRREGLDVETVWAMHTSPFPWQEVLAAVEAVRRAP